jgi:NDP-sugar pyrophosphorylase family protein
MFQLNIASNAEAYAEMPIFKFIDQFSELVKIKIDENFNSGDLQVLYLSAGFGRRLRPLTETVPKPMLTISGDPIIKLLIDGIQRHFPSASHIINISHLADKFAALKSRYNSEINLSYSYEHIPVGSVQTLFNLAHKSNFEKDILVIHGDLVLGKEYEEELANVLKNEQNSIIFGHHRFGFSARSSIVLDKDMTVVSFSNEPQLDEAMHVVNSGIYFFKSQDLRNAYSLDLSGEIPDTLIPVLIQNGALHGRVIDHPRISIDSIDSLNRAQEFFI